MGKSDLRIDWATHEAAKYACENWHYSKTCPMPPIVRIGVWELGKFIGVVLFSRGASAHLMKPYGLTQTQGCELTRIALSKHQAPVSKIVKLAVMYLKRNSPMLRLIVSFADPHYGHHGGVYQAGNWLYAGKTSHSFEYFYNGKRLHQRQVSSSGYVMQFGKRTKVPKPKECKIVRVDGKHRYLMPLDDEMRKQIEPLRKPYPKRVRSADSGTPDIQSGGGGANPTRTLSDEASHAQAPASDRK